MASRTVVELTDDVDGGKAAETVSFALDGHSYQIDLSAKNAKALRSAVETYIAAGRKVGGRGGSRPARRGNAGHNPAAVRAWAASNKIKVSPRGRIRADVLEQYRSAGN